MLRACASIACAALLVMTPPERGALDAAGTWQGPRIAKPADRLSVLTYNVHGLPAWLRKAEVAPLEAISGRLRDLRRAGRQPDIVLLQEAFTGEAQAIGRAGGYRYVAPGPGAADPVPASASRGTPLDSARWWAGEGQGKYVGSGLMILSDHPVVAVRRLPFPDRACAGFDCLSNKGVLLVSVRLPGQKVPVDIVTTHLNSRGASGVSDDRSIIAYRRQVDALFAFLSANRDPDRPLVFAGDLNIGKAAPRRAAFFARLSAFGARDAVAGAATRGPLPADALEARRRGKDWMFWADGKRLRLEPVAVAVPFGREADGSMLSDHIGFAAEYRLTQAGQGRIS